MTCTFRKKKKKILSQIKKKINVLPFTTCYNKTIYCLLLRPLIHIQSINQRSL